MNDIAAISPSTEPSTSKNYDLPSDDDTSEGGYGWIVTVSVAVVNAHSWGISAAYSVFLAYYLQEDTFPNTSALMYATVGSLSIGITMLFSPFITLMVRLLGTRLTMLIGAILQTISLVCASFSTKIWHLFLSQGLIFGLGMGLLFLPSYGIISHWFRKRRALANGIAIAGAGLGGLTYSLAVESIIRNISLEWAYRTLAIVSAVANIVCTSLIKFPNGTIQAHQLALDTSLLRRGDYLLLLSFGALSMLGYFILIFTLANYANVIGLDSSQASMVPALFMLGQAIGRPGIGWLSDRLGRLNTTCIMTLITGILILTVWTSAKSFGVLAFFALTVGLSAGVFWVNIAPVLVEVLGLKNLASALSVLWVAMAVPSTFSAPIALLIYSGTGSYFGAQLFTGIAFISASLCMLIMRQWQIARYKRNNEGNSISTRV
ncbi:hypothetical protein FSST1_002846 [Fusarium sambucinum]